MGVQIAPYSLSAPKIQYDLLFLARLFKKSPNRNLDCVHPQPVPTVDER